MSAPSRAAAEPAHAPVLARGDLRLDTVQRVASRGGRRLSLSPKELAVLELLLAADGAPVSARQLVARGWDEYIDPDGSVVKVTISRLRRKLGDPPADRDRPPHRLPDRSMSAAPQPVSPPLAARRLPARTIRLRLTLVYGGLFLCSGATLLALTYVLVRHQYTGSFFISSGRQAVVAVQRPATT